MFLGLKPIDIAAIVGYFAIVMLVGFWVARRVKNETDYFLGGRKFGKGLLIMHWLCTGTHSDMAVQVAGATARVGLGGIWYQWMWLFSTPFYWLIAPVNRRLRVVTTGDFFRIRYGQSAELLYTLVALVYMVLSVALLLRGAGAAISGATGGAIAIGPSVIVLSILFSTYIMAGGLVAAAYTDFLQGVMIIVLSLLLVPFGLAHVGGLSEVRRVLGEAAFSITAPASANEGNVWFVLAWSVLGLVGIVVQPHVMGATGSGKTELEARVGMCYGNFIKRLLTIAWAFTGLIAVVAFPAVLKGLDPASDAAHRASETLFGQAIQQFLGDGWRGLMIACLIAGVTSAETFMVVGSALVTRNICGRWFGGSPDDKSADRRSLWVARLASAGILAVSILVAFTAGSVTQLLKSSVQVIGLLGAAFWLGAIWRPANAKGVWASFAAGVLIWAATSVSPTALREVPGVGQTLYDGFTMAGGERLSALTKPAQIALMLSVQFGAFVVVSLLTRPHDRVALDFFYARLLTPVGAEAAVAPSGSPPYQGGAGGVESAVTGNSANPDSATLGMDGVRLDYAKASAYAYAGLRRLGIEIPRMTGADWGGFLAAWGFVFGLIGLLVWLAGLGK